jgi:hypothetical protein
MTGGDGVISSTDPDTGKPIRIRCRGDEWTWQPVTAVVVIGHADSCGTMANTVCRSITFHADPNVRNRTSTSIPNLKASSSAGPTRPTLTLE